MFLNLRRGAARAYKNNGSNSLCLECSICLSRACLGKTIPFFNIYKWLEKTLFAHPAAGAFAPNRPLRVQRLGTEALRSPPRSCEKRHFCAIYVQKR